MNLGRIYDLIGEKFGNYPFGNQFETLFDAIVNRTDSTDTVKLQLLRALISMYYN